MQLEDKLVDGREAAHAESQQRADVLEHGEDTLPAAMVEAVQDAALERRGQLLGVIRMILDRQTLRVDQLRLPQRESRALEALQVAASGKSYDLGQFVYATDRRDLLEQALAVLQPDLTHADDRTARELHAQLADLSERVSELRHALLDLEDAQDELLEGHPEAAHAKAATDPAESTAPSESSARPTPTPSDPDAPRPATTLVGPELPEPAKPPTTLAGPELPSAPAPASTLTGPELAPEAAPASSLGDADELAAQAKLPWWRRPFG